MAVGRWASSSVLPSRRLGFAAAAVALAVPAAVLTVVYVGQAGHWFMTDLQVYRWGGLLARRSGPLYAAKFQGALSFSYPPLSAAVFELLSAVPMLAVKRVVIAGSVLALFGSAWLAVGSAGLRGRAARAAAALAVTDIALCTDPVQQTIDLGQINLLLMVLVLADLLAPGDRWWRGAGVGLATGLKLTPGIFICYLLVTRRFRAAGTATAAFALTVAVGFAALPGPSRQYWLGGLFLDSSRPGPVIYASNQSLLGAIARLAGGSGPALPYWLGAALPVAAIGLLAAAVEHRRGRELAAVSLCAVTGLLISPVSWDHHWVWVVPVFVAVAEAAWRHRSPALWASLVGLILVFAAYPGVGQPGDPGAVKGLIWSVPAGGNREYRWHGWQLVAGNLYALAGLGMLCAALAGHWILRERRRGRPSGDDLLAAAQHGAVPVGGGQDVKARGPDPVDHEPRDVGG
jgi:alpha-1,2-mannosyltransferase